MWLGALQCTWDREGRRRLIQTCSKCSKVLETYLCIWQIHAQNRSELSAKVRNTTNNQRKQQCILTKINSSVNEGSRSKWFCKRVTLSHSSCASVFHSRWAICNKQILWLFVYVGVWVWSISHLHCISFIVLNSALWTNEQILAHLCDLSSHNLIVITIYIYIYIYIYI